MQHSSRPSDNTHGDYPVQGPPLVNQKHPTSSAVHRPDYQSLAQNHFRSVQQQPAEVLSSVRTDVRANSLGVNDNHALRTGIQNKSYEVDEAVSRADHYRLKMIHYQQCLNFERETHHAHEMSLHRQFKYIIAQNAFGTQRRHIVEAELQRRDEVIALCQKRRVTAPNSHGTVHTPSPPETFENSPSLKDYDSESVVLTPNRRGKVRISSPRRVHSLEGAVLTPNAHGTVRISSPQQDLLSQCAILTPTPRRTVRYYPPHEQADWTNSSQQNLPDQGSTSRQDPTDEMPTSREDSPRPKAVQTPTSRQDTPRHDAVQAPASRQDPPRQEVAKTLASRQDLPRQKAAKTPASRQDTLHERAVQKSTFQQEPPRQKAAKSPTSRQDPPREKSVQTSASRQDTPHEKAVQTPTFRQDLPHLEAFQTPTSRQYPPHPEAVQTLISRQYPHEKVARTPTSHGKDRISTPQQESPTLARSTAPLGTLIPALSSQVIQVPLTNPRQVRKEVEQAKGGVLVRKEATAHVPQYQQQHVGSNGNPTAASYVSKSLSVPY
jgi:hypothetical protein